jgi:hypothetical protein
VTFLHLLNTLHQLPLSPKPRCCPSSSTPLFPPSSSLSPHSSTLSSNEQPNPHSGHRYGLASVETPSRVRRRNRQRLLLRRGMRRHCWAASSSSTSRRPSESLRRAPGEVGITSPSSRNRRCRLRLLLPTLLLLPLAPPPPSPTLLPRPSISHLPLPTTLATPDGWPTPSSRFTGTKPGGLSNPVRDETRQLLRRRCPLRRGEGAGAVVGGRASMITMF